jgi:hypothetical protein
MGVNVPSVRRSGDTMRGNLTINKSGTGAKLAAINGADSDRGFIAQTAVDSVQVGTNSAAYHLDFVIDSNVKQRLDTNFERKTVTKNGSTLYPAFDCRAWVNFNATGTVAIRASGNVSSITDNGIGIYRVNFSQNMPDTSYSANANSSFDGTVGGRDNSTNVYAHGLSYADIASCRAPSGNFEDPIICNVQIFR